MLKISRLLILIIFIIFQVLLYIIKFKYINAFILIIIYKIYIVSLLLYILKNKNNLSYYIPWISIIILFPIMGSILYLIISSNIFVNKKLLHIDNSTIYKPSYNNKLKYYSMGIYQYNDIIKSLRKAKKYIFIESFLINDSYMWNKILDILITKSKNNVDIRIIYDDMGSNGKLPSNYSSILNNYNIKCLKFNKINTIFGSIMNNRDHRKIIIVDGLITYIGGLNLSDEYINIDSKLGNFKESGISIQGDSVRDYIKMFLSIWNIYYNIKEDYNKYMIYNNNYKSNGVSIPYSYNPLSSNKTTYNMYLSNINKSREAIYITTPYLILDNVFITSLELSIKRGVDINIVIPKNPDKKNVYILMEYYIYKLLKMGVKVYKYNDYIHSKVLLIDDKISIIGSANFNNRSLFLDFECGLYMENTNVINDIKKDMLDTINNSNIITIDCVKPNIFKKIYQSILLLLSGLM